MPIVLNTYTVFGSVVSTSATQIPYAFYHAGDARLARLANGHFSLCRLNSNQYCTSNWAVLPADPTTQSYLGLLTHAQTT